MGTVYEALQDNPRRKVAIKVMKQGVTSSSALRRFQFESQVLARLHHPGIAQVYEAQHALEIIDEAITGYETAKELEPTDGMKLQVLRADACARLDRGDEARTILDSLLSGSQDDPAETLSIVSFMLGRNSPRLLDLDAEALMAAVVRGHAQSEQDGPRGERVLARLHAARGDHAQAVHWQEQALSVALPLHRKIRQEQLDEYRTAVAESKRDAADTAQETPE